MEKTKSAAAVIRAAIETSPNAKARELLDIVTKSGVETTIHSVNAALYQVRKEQKAINVTDDEVLLELNALAKKIGVERLTERFELFKKLVA